MSIRYLTTKRLLKTCCAMSSPIPVPVTLEGVRAALVLAHRAKNWELACVLSQLKQQFRGSSLDYNTCVTCGKTIGNNSRRCFRCSQNLRYRDHRIQRQ